MWTPPPPFASNPLKTRVDLSQFLTSLLDPLAAHTSPGGARIHLGFTGTHFDETAAHLEGFSRPIWGLASLLAGGSPYAGTERWVRGFESGTDPEHEEFWGDMRDRDQRMVECSAIGFCLSVAKEQIWDKMNARGKANLEQWLGGMNDKKMPNTNWLWFRVFSNLGLSRVGSSFFSSERLKADMDHLDTFYIGDGWSRDGPEGVVQLDYYSSSFAIQFAQLIYSKLAWNDDRERCAAYKERARQFALDFMWYFDPEGRAVPFGRSLTYRFAMSSFWGACAFANVELPAPLTWGVVKGLQLRNIRWWTQQAGAYNVDGTLTIGYVYPNGAMTENYNSPGSPYWCCKSFITLALPETHPFWTAAEEPYPSHLLTPFAKPLHKPFHIATHSAVPGSGSALTHSYILSSGQRCSYAVKNSAAKYGKFGYSTAFGYSVAVSNGLGGPGLEEVGADSVLALRDLEHDEGWRCRRRVDDARFEPNPQEDRAEWLRSVWRPYPGVEVETWLVPPSAAAPLWHLRVHRIRTNRRLAAAEGGWAGDGQRWDGRHLDEVTGVNEFADQKSTKTKGYGYLESAGGETAGAAVVVVSKSGVSGIVDLSPSSENAAAVGSGKRTGKAFRTDANTNIMFPRAIVPTLMAELDPTSKGQDVWWATAVFGIPAREGEAGPPEGWELEWMKRPIVPEGIVKLMQ
ncbi:hypothetical protein PHLGIDRAFT_83306 [Phlebiopsis gigantea 11061_1 CR5-6]|uniref:DUF2264 domain-containing protein n=1 Tax=Phlebiopsis gigantea (strain 11061_1 CR5-6) TaxID=745531 RepID=A0A0C3P1D6_PHLG1|nr:hypothetical protein PHLGIDRAFT_83306 [Phlebiopsis gigantea 11061_1 CR5-6]